MRSRLKVIVPGAIPRVLEVVLAPGVFVREFVAVCHFGNRLIGRHLASELADIVRWRPILLTTGGDKQNSEQRLCHQGNDTHWRTIRALGAAPVVQSMNFTTRSRLIGTLQ